MSDAPTDPPRETAPRRPSRPWQWAAAGGACLLAAVLLWFGGFAFGSESIAWSDGDASIVYEGEYEGEPYSEEIYAEELVDGPAGVASYLGFLALPILLYVVGGALLAVGVVAKGVQVGVRSARD